jgi:hypothetical protein
MGTAFYVLVPVALALTVLVLLLGLLSMARGGATSAKWSNKLMRARVFMQLVAILLIAAAMLLAQR